MNNNSMAIIFGICCGVATLVYLSYDSPSKSDVPSDSATLSNSASDQNAINDQNAIKVMKFGIESDWQRNIGGSRCEKYGSTIIVERVKKTAGKLNHPAYIYRINFKCHHSKSGISDEEYYVAWVDNPNTNSFRCISARSVEYASLAYMKTIYRWDSCGGLNP